MRPFTISTTCPLNCQHLRVTTSIKAVFSRTLCTALLSIDMLVGNVFVLKCCKCIFLIWLHLWIVMSQYTVVVEDVLLQAEDCFLISDFFTLNYGKLAFKICQYCNKIASWICQNCGNQLLIFDLTDQTTLVSRRI